MADKYATGLYEIVNVTNGKRYIGSAVSCANRFSVHRNRLNKGAHHSPALQSAWLKYGKEIFAFRQIMVCAKDDMLFYEQRAIDVLKPEYNVNPSAINCLGRVLSQVTRQKIAAKHIGRKHSPEVVETRASKLRGKKLPPERIVHLLGNKFSANRNHTSEWKAAASIRMTGQKRPKSAEHRAKISSALTGRHPTPEARANQSAAQLGRKHSKPYNLDPAKAEQRTTAGQRLAEGNRGRKRNPESVAKMRATLTGRKLSPEHRASISRGLDIAWRTTRRKKPSGQGDLFD